MGRGPGADLKFEGAGGGSGGAYAPLLPRRGNTAGVIYDLKEADRHSSLIVRQLRQVASLLLESHHQARHHQWAAQAQAPYPHGSLLFSSALLGTGWGGLVVPPWWGGKGWCGG